MNIRDTKIVELKANKILLEFNVREVPVDIENIADKLGIKISYAPSEEYSGMLIRKEDDQALMGINSSEPKTRMRFTVAHEIAHFLFDKKNKVSIDYRTSTKLLDKPEEEKRADLFAANVLMPKKLLTLDFEKISKESFSQKHLIDLAKKYQVSQDAMKYRLMSLRLISLA